MKYFKFTIRNFKEFVLADHYLRTSEMSREELTLYGKELVDEFLISRGCEESAKELGIFVLYKEITQAEYEEEL